MLSKNTYSTYSKENLLNMYRFGNQITFFAAWMATLVSPAFMLGTDPITAPVAGFVTWKVSPEIK